MTALANMSKGAINAVNSAFKARRSMIFVISSFHGNKNSYGNDPAGQAVASNITTQARSAELRKNAEDGISFLRSESILFEMASLNTC